MQAALTSIRQIHDDDSITVADLTGDTQAMLSINSLMKEHNERVAKLLAEEAELFKKIDSTENYRVKAILLTRRSTDIVFDTLRTHIEDYAQIRSFGHKCYTSKSPHYQIDSFIKLLREGVEN